MKYAALILVLLASSLSADESTNRKTYLCIPDKATGFRFNDETKSWEPTTFRVDETKYIVRPIDPNGTDNSWIPVDYAYGIWRFGDDDAMVSCEEGIKQNWINCGGITNTNFTINTRSNRFMHISNGTYMIATFDWVIGKDGMIAVDEAGDTIIVEVPDSGGDTPFMEIGKCSKI